MVHSIIQLPHCTAGSGLSAWTGITVLASLASVAAFISGSANALPNLLHASPLLQINAPPLCSSTHHLFAEIAAIYSEVVQGRRPPGAVNSVRFIR